MRKLQNKELERISVSEFKNAPKLPVIIVLDNVRSSYNVGAVFRTADAFIAEGVYLCGITATPPNREVQKTALGATESVDWKFFDNTIEAVTRLKKSGYLVFAVEQAAESIDLSEFEPVKNQKYALVFGHEVKGVSQEVVDICNGCIEIPQKGTKHSLNISIAAGIVLWSLFFKIKMLVLILFLYICAKFL